MSTHFLKPSDVKVLHGGYMCYVRNVTLTTRQPWSLSMGMNMLRELLNKQPESFVDYVFYPEYSDNGMFHFHGVVYYRNKVHFNSFLSHWGHFYGYYNCQIELKPSLHWHFYCRKDNHLVTLKRSRIAKHEHLARRAPSFWEFEQNSPKTSIPKLNIEII